MTSVKFSNPMENMSGVSSEDAAGGGLEGGSSPVAVRVSVQPGREHERGQLEFEVHREGPLFKVIAVRAKSLRTNDEGDVPVEVSVAITVGAKKKITAVAQCEGNTAQWGKSPNSPKSPRPSGEMVFVIGGESRDYIAEKRDYDAHQQDRLGGIAGVRSVRDTRRRSSAAK
jgi:hypothetical protein